MAASAEYAPPKELVNVRVQSSGKLEGAASLLEMLEDKADNRRITASELAALRGKPRRGPGTRLDKTRASPNRTGPCKTLRFFYVRLYSQISRTASIVLARNDRNDTKAFCSPYLWQWSFKAPDSSTSAAFVSDDL